jgi:hypothetical protein
MPRHTKGMYGMGRMRGSKPVSTATWDGPSVYFDNNPITNGTYMDVGSAITHPATWNNKEGFIATTVKLYSGATTERIFSNAYGQFSLYFDGGGSNRLTLYGRDSSLTTVIRIASTSQSLDDGNWHTIAASFNTATGSQATHLYIDGVSNSSLLINIADGIVDYDRTTTPPVNPGGIDWAVGGSTGGSNLTDMCIGAFVFSDEYIDLSAAGALDLIFNSHNNNDMKNPGTGESYGLSDPALFVFSNTATTYHINNGASSVEDMIQKGVALSAGCQQAQAPYDPALTFTLHGADWGDSKEVTTIDNNNNNISGYATATTNLNAKVAEAWRVPQTYTLTYNSESTYDYVPQGAYFTAAGVMYGAAYHKNDTDASIVMVYDTAGDSGNGTLDKIYILQNSGGSDFTKHCGGCIVSGDNIIITQHNGTQVTSFVHFDMTTASEVVGSGGVEWEVEAGTIVNAGNGSYPTTPDTNGNGTYYGVAYNPAVSSCGIANDHNGNPFAWVAYYASRTWILGFAMTGDAVTGTTPTYAFEIASYNDGRSIQGLDLKSASASEYRFIISRSAQGTIDWSAVTEVVFPGPNDDPGGDQTDWLPALPASSYTNHHYGPLGNEGCSFISPSTVWTWSESGCSKYYGNSLWSDSFPYIIKVDIS